MQSWLDGFARIDLDLTGVNAPEVGRPYDERSHPKICLHTTEGSSIEGAERAFAAYPPHVGVEFGRRLLHQYLPLDRCSFSLRGSESDDEFVVQVEIVGFANHYQTGAEADWLGREVIAPIAQAIGCPLVSVPQGFHGPSSGMVLASTSSPIRFKNESELRRFSGVFGHQHAPPPDTHWDPGAIDIDRILAAAGGATKGDWFDMASKRDLERIVKIYARNQQRAWMERELPGIIRAATPSIEQINLVAIAAARFARDEDPDEPVDVEELATAVGEAARQAVTEALPAALADLDAETVAAAVVEALPPELAQQVVAEIGVRLGDGD